MKYDVLFLGEGGGTATGGRGKAKKAAKKGGKAKKAKKRGRKK